MYKIFVEGTIVAAADFDLCWPRVDPTAAPSGVIEPFIPLLAEKGIQPVEKSLKLLTDKTRMRICPWTATTLTWIWRAAFRPRRAGVGACCRSTA